VTRRRTSLSALKTTLQALKEGDLRPCALDSLPDGTMRWHFTEPPSHDEDSLDRELKAFEAKHGYGRA
jgi:hypothetical protein